MLHRKLSKYRAFGVPALVLAALGAPLSPAAATTTAEEPVGILIQALPGGHPYLLWDEKPPAPEGAYWALACAGARCRLEAASAHWAPDAVPTYAEPEATAQRLYTLAAPDAIVLVRGIPGLAPGPVPTEYVNPMFPATRDLAVLEEPGHPDLVWQLGSRQLRVRLEWIDTDDSVCQPHCAARWLLDGDGPSVELARTEIDGHYRNSGIFAPQDFLVWAGDLDRDGRTDFLVRPQSRPDYIELRLLLGRERPKAGEPWPAAASFYWWDPENLGC